MRIDKEGVRLEEFDQEFFDTIEDREYVELEKYRHLYTEIYTVISEGNKIGMVGYIRLKNCNYLQIAIHQDYRGQGFMKVMIEKLAEHASVCHFFATIARGNLRSLQGLIKAGFGFLPAWQDSIEARKRGDGYFSMIRYF